MAISLVQDYLNMAMSLTVGNKSGSDTSFRLPNDLRKFADLKVKSFSTRTFVVAAAALTEVIARVDSEDSAAVVIFSNPVVITHVNGGAVTPFTTSLYVSMRDRSGSASYASNIIQYNNTLGAPSYRLITPGSETDVTVFVITIRLEN